MRRATQSQLGLGRRLLEHEAEGSESPTELAEAAERVFRKLNGGLAKMLGLEGCYALLSRALHLAAAEHPILRTVAASRPQGTASPDEPLRGLRESLEDRSPPDAVAAISTVIGSFIWLLATFVGEDIALGQLRRIWPAGPFEQAASGSQESEQ